MVVPFGLDAADRLIPADQAARERGPYRCPGCESFLVVRRQSVRARQHLAHPGGRGCSEESILHRAAKFVVAKTVKDWRAGLREAPSIFRFCSRRHVHQQRMPDTVADAVIERALSPKVRPDVLLLGRDGNPVAAIEVFFSNPVSQEKRPLLTIPWMELFADEVLADSDAWVARASGLLKEMRCVACEEEKRESVVREAQDAIEQQVEEDYREKEEIHAELVRKLLAPGRDERFKKVVELCRLHGVIVPRAPYFAEPYACWSCFAEIPVFTWRGNKGMATAPPPDPAPKTILRRRDWSTEAYYWANTCPQCKKTQGDDHLYGFIFHVFR